MMIGKVLYVQFKDNNQDFAKSIVTDLVLHVNTHSH